jgi:pimeloyl-ACP methyl ester carboxylesterase
MLAAADDNVIPPAHAEKLHAAWQGPKQLVVLRGVGHNDIQEHRDFYVHIGAFLATPGKR